MGVPAILPIGVDLGDVRDAGFDGCRAIPDVHGQYDALEEALAAADADRRFVVQLGDVVDRGPWSPLCAERMLDLEAAGKGLMLPGNHEIALVRAALQGGGTPVRMETLAQFEEHGGGLLERFVDRIARGPVWARSGSHLFVHAAFHPAMLSSRPPPDLDLLAIATQGYGTAAERRAGAHGRGWVDAVPAGLTVVVGHAVTESRGVEVAVNRRGGRAVFADTGSWIDGGKLAHHDA